MHFQESVIFWTYTIFFQDSLNRLNFPISHMFYSCELSFFTPRNDDQVARDCIYIERTKYKIMDLSFQNVMK